jgi:hypothetical protein
VAAEGAEHLQGRRRVRASLHVPRNDDVQCEDAGDAAMDHFQEGALGLVGIAGGAVGMGEGLGERLDRPGAGEATRRRW